VKLTADVIAGFSSSLLQQYFDDATDSPACHYEWWRLFTSNHPQVAIAAPRGHAKSTACTLTYLLAAVCFREREYVILVSDTIAQATQFLNDVKKQLLDNEKLRALFSIKELIKDTEEDIIVMCEDGHLFRIQAKGSEQKLRGLKWNNKRPDLIIGDDLENDEIVMNPDRRKKFQRWFYGALLPCRSRHGIIRIVGTILHEDSFLNNVMPKEYDRWTRTTELKIWSEKLGPWLAVKYRAHNEDFTQILWENRYNQKFFEDKRQDYIERGLPDLYSQEYLNTPIDESIAYFRKADFLALNAEEKNRTLHWYVTADLAVSEKETADYSVFVVAGVDENKILQVRNVIRDRMDAREIVDTVISLQRIYNPELFGIERMQVSQAIGPFLREEMVKSGVYVNLKLLEHMGKDKQTRAKSIQARMRAGGVKFDKEGDWYFAFEEELKKFPRATRNDQVDAFAYLGLMLDSIIEAPTKDELDEEEYLEQLQQSGLGNAGRSATTGY